MNRILMIVFHFPPLKFGSGIHRTLHFVRDLPALGWQPTVVTAAARAYAEVDASMDHLLPSDVHVERPFTLDMGRDIAINGRYPGIAAIPDRWWPWRLWAVPAAVRLVKTLRPAFIWSTYPIATAHEIAARVHERTGVPWIADFRDPMAQLGYPDDARKWASFKRIEETALREASACVFTTPGAAETYRRRYAYLGARRIEVIENGFDEAAFQGIDTSPRPNGSPLLVVHSGYIYPEERDPTQLFAALCELRRQGRIGPGDVLFRLRAAGNDALLNSLIHQHELQELVEVAPALPHRQALAEVIAADALLILQGASCNVQIPAKLYECLRARKPILALTDSTGDTALTLRKYGLTDILPLNSKDAIAAGLPTFLDRVRQGVAHIPSALQVEAASRSHRSRQLAALLDELSAVHA